MERFGFGHGKGEYNGASAIIKFTHTHEQLKTDGVHMKCIVEYLRKPMSSSATYLLVFHENQAKLVWAHAYGEKHDVYDKIVLEWMSMTRLMGI